MASDDLDPIFVKALKLLLSKSNDSIGKLKHLADEFIEQRKKEVAIEIAVVIIFDFLLIESIVIILALIFSVQTL